MFDIFSPKKYLYDESIINIINLFTFDWQTDEL